MMFLVNRLLKGMSDCERWFPLERVKATRTLRVVRKRHRGRLSVPRFGLRVTRKLQSRLAMDDVKALDTRSNLPYNPRASL